MSRTLCLAALVCMMFSMAACNGSGSSDGNRYVNRVHLNLASIQGIEGYDYTAGDAIAKFYSDKFNYELNVVHLNWDNWNDRLREWIYSGNMPDIAVFNYNHSHAARFVERKLIKRLPDNWKVRWPNAAKVYEATALGPVMDEVFEGTYFLPRARFMDNLPGVPLQNHLSLYIRKDWAQTVGFPIKTTYTVSEIIELGKRIKDADPGNLASQLVPLAQNTIYAVELFVGRNSTHYNTFYRDSNGTYQWGAASQETLTGLKLFSEAYRSGVLNIDFYRVRDEAHGQMFNITGVAAMTYTQAPTANLQGFYNTFQNSFSLDPYEHIQMATVLGESGYFHQRDLINYWGTIIFSPTVSKEVFERYMDILDYNSTREGYLTTVLGLKDVDWEYDREGNVVSLFHEADAGISLGEADGKYPSWGYLLGSMLLFDDFAFDNPNYDVRLRTASRQLYADRASIATSQSFTPTDWDLFTFDSSSMRSAQLDYHTELAQLVVMDGDIEDNWRRWVESKMPIIQPVLDELNDVLAR